MTNEEFRKSITSSCCMAVFLGCIIGLSAFNAKQYKDNKNVIVENKDTKLLVEDVDTKDQRILNFSRQEYQQDIKYLQPGDTVTVKTKENIYAKNKVIVANKSNVIFNADSVHVRKQREIFESQKQQMQKQR